MAKSKKTKIHKKIDGQLLQLNKKFSDLKMKQKDKITGWVYEEYRKYVTEYDTGRRNFVKIAQELGISHRVHFTGMISNLDVHQNLINSAMHVVPSLAEPFGITAIESMLDGTPVIASNSGGLKEIVEDEKTGLLVSPGDVDMLASAILRLWQHPELRKKLAGASIEKARNVYTWENVSAFTRNVYTQAIANGNGC